MRHRGSLLISLVLVLASLPLMAQPSFGLKTNHLSEELSQPFIAALADLNGDGRLDMVSGNTSNTVSIFLNTTLPGADTASFSENTDIVTGSVVQGLGIGDINGDGRPDVVAANLISSTMSVLLNSTSPGSLTPSFYQKTDHATDANPKSLAVADFNGDGRPDVIMVDGHITLFRNTTPFNDTVATFASYQIFVAGSGSTQLAVGDVNGDGRPDVAVTNIGSTSRNVSILLNTTNVGASSVSFSGPTDLAIDGVMVPEGVALGDLNGDGMPDLAVTLYAKDSLLVYLNTTVRGSSTASFSSWSAYDVGNGPYSVIIGDLNADNVGDIITTNTLAFGVSVLLNETPAGASSPSLSSVSDFVFSQQPYVSALGDLNGDGLPDLAVPNYSASDYVAVRMNTTPVGVSSLSFGTEECDSLKEPMSTVLGDLNGDGKLDVVSATIQSGIIGKFSIRFNTTPVGSASTSFSDRSTFSIGGNPGLTSIYGVAVATADLNGDGKRDIIATDASSTNDSLAIFMNATSLGASSPTFGSRLPYAAGGYPAPLDAADINLDGKPDLVFSTNANSISVMLNTTPWEEPIPTFAARAEFSAGDGAGSFAIGDLNGDGLPDIVVTNYFDNTASVLLNATTPGASTPSFASAYNVSTETGPGGVWLEDVNMDGVLDLIVNHWDELNIGVHVNATTPGSSTPSFAAPILIETDANPQIVTTGDLNEDARPDLVVGLGLSNIAIFLNSTSGVNPTPSFEPATTVAAGIFTSILSVVDMNSDGSPDLVTTKGNEGISVRLNGSAVPLPVQMGSVRAEVSASAPFGVTLRWTTATETDNAGWEVERRVVSRQYGVGSKEKEGWVKIGFVEGAGTSTSAREYSFTDRSIFDNRQSSIDTRQSTIANSTRFVYRLKQLDRSGAFSYSHEVEVEIGTAPREFTLGQNYPNPFNPATSIEFTVPADGRAVLKVFDMLGREVATLFEGVAAAGRFNRISFDASHLPSGLYFYRLESETHSAVRTMVILK